MGRFESPALVGQIVPLLSDADPAVRQAAAIATANAAKVFPTQAIEALLTAMGTAPPADWAVLAASLGRITLPAAADFTAAEQAIAAGLPAVELRAQVTRPARPATRPTDPVRVEGAARGLEALVRVNGKLGDTLGRHAVAALRRGGDAAGGVGTRTGAGAAAGAAGAAQRPGDRRRPGAGRGEGSRRRGAPAGDDRGRGRRGRQRRHPRRRPRGDPSCRAQGHRAAGPSRGAPRLGPSCAGARLSAGGRRRGRRQHPCCPAGDRPAGRRMSRQRAGLGAPAAAGRSPAGI